MSRKTSLVKSHCLIFRLAYIAATMQTTDPFKSMIDTTQRRAARISTRHGEQSTPLGSMLEREGAHTRGETHTHTHTHIPIIFS